MTKAVAAKSWNLAAIGGRRHSIGNSALATACASLDPGECVKFADLASSVLAFSGETSDLTKYASSGCYDPLRRQVRFIGRRESADFPYHGISYDEATETWANDDWDLWSTDTVSSGHGYDHNAVDPATGDHYFKLYNSGDVWKWDGSWTQLASVGSVAIAGSLEWIPRIGLLYSDRRWIKLLGIGQSDWSTIEDNGAGVSNPYHAVSQYNPNSGVIILGAGNTDTAMRKIVVTGKTLGSPASIATPPFNIGSGEDHSVFVHDPEGDNFIAWNKKTNDWAEYAVAGDEWNTLTQSAGNGATPQTGLPNISDAAGGHPTFAVPISRYRRIMIVQSTGSGGTAWLYRHTAAA